jgi:hypothetical protein
VTIDNATANPRRPTSRLRLTANLYPLHRNRFALPTPLRERARPIGNEKMAWAAYEVRFDLSLHERGKEGDPKSFFVKLMRVIHTRKQEAAAVIQIPRKIGFALVGLRVGCRT